MSKAMELYLQEAGILRRHAMRAEPHSNRVAERAIQTIGQMTVLMIT